MREYSPLTLTLLAPGARVAEPMTPGRVTLDDPAFSVMTDLREVSAATTRPEETIDAAHAQMIRRAVRLLFVLDDDRTASPGVITATDLLGDKPVRFMQDRGVSHSEILVGDIMTPASRLEALPLVDVAQMRVGHVVATLKKVGRKHLTVAEDGGRRVRGPFLGLADRAPAGHGAADLRGRELLRRRRGRARPIAPCAIAIARSTTSFRWNVPPDFNIAHWTCRRWAGDRRRVALVWEDEAGRQRDLDVLGACCKAANRLSNALRVVRHRARRSRRPHPSAAPADARRLPRLLPDGRDRGAAFIPVRARRAGVPPRRQRRARRRSSIRSTLANLEPLRSRLPRPSPRDRRRRRARRRRSRLGRDPRARVVRSSSPSPRATTIPRPSSTRAEPRDRRRARCFRTAR